MSAIRKFGLVVGMGLGLGLAAAGQAQTVGYNIRTGDLWVDTRLGEINDYGSRYRDPFVGEMTGYYGAPRSLIVELLDRRRWAPADIYYACAIAHALRIPCLNVVREYDRNPKQGWGNVAKQLGIKPGSPAFHALKRGTVATYDRWGYPVAIDRPVRVDWSQHGPGGKQANGKRASVAAVQVDSGNASGKGKDKVHAQGKGHSQSKGKGQGKDK